jgi:hypothetical protein
MFGILIPAVMMAFAVWLGMVAADKLFALSQDRWRYRLRSVFIVTAIVAVILTALVSTIRR